MSAFFHAVETFFEHLASVEWEPLGVALLFHVARLVVRTWAWRNILAAAYPDARVRRRGVFGAYVAGVGVNAVTPARGGDVVKLYLVKRRIEGSTYPTIASTLVVETLLDLVVASALFAWVLTLGVLPGLDVLPDLPTIDWSWPLRHARLSAVVGGLALAVLAVLALWTIRRIEAFWRRVAQGFAIFRDRGRYLREVASWQAVGWVFRLATLYWFLRAFGVQANLHNAFLVQIAQSLSTVLPLTPGGAGTQQGLLVYLFQGKVPTTALLSFSVGMHIALVVLNVLLGFAAIAVMLRTLRWRRVVPDEELADAESRG